MNFHSNPFYPIDSTFGNIIYLSLENKSLFNQTLKKWIYPEENFFISSSIQKQYYLSNLPDVIRKEIEQDNEEKIIQNILLPLEEQKCLDLTFELLEWFFISYENKKLTLKTLYKLFREEIEINETIWDKLNLNYSKLME